MKKFISVFTAAAFFFAAFLINAHAWAPNETESIAACKNVCVYNIDSGSFVFEKAADEKIAPASAVKIMTAILAIEHFGENTDAVITVSKEAQKATVGNNIGLAEGETLSADELLHALIIAGAGDAANVFAVEIGGSIDGFCELMNEKAKEIGADSTVYKNASGIDEASMTTTARDTALIAAYAYKLPYFEEYSSIARYVMAATNKSGARVIHNRNYLLSTHIEPKYYDSRAIGLNSGYTEKGGQCVITAARSKGLTYIFAVMGSSRDENGSNRAFLAASDLMDMTLDSFGYVDVLSPQSVVYEVPVRLAKNVDYVIVSPKDKVMHFLPLDTDVDSEITYNTRFESDSLTAPLYESEEVGSIDVIYRGEVISTVPLVTKNTVSASTFLKLTDYLRNLLKSRQIKIALTVFAIIFAAYLFFCYLSFVRRHRKRNRFK